MPNELIPFRVTDKTRNHGAVFVLAHPDDEAMMWGMMQHLLLESVSVHTIIMTLGELGTGSISNPTPERVKEIRRQEFLNAMESLGVTCHILEFPDLYLGLLPKDILIPALLELIRKIRPGIVISFHPTEYTVNFDHPDHRVTGELATFVAAASDVSNFHPLSSESAADHTTLEPAMSWRPELYLFGTNPGLATHSVSLTPAMDEARVDYLVKHHPSQFSPHFQDWQHYFDRMTCPSETIDIRLETYTRIRD